jgi:lysozyme family protein
MAAADFARSLKLVLVDEGGLDDDPHDHGGRTAYGIIQREYSGYRRRKGKSPQDVWKISHDEVTEIYHDQYWVPWCDKLAAGIDYVYFDFAVNAGPVQAARTFQRVLGVRVDGNMGQSTLDAANEAAKKDVNKLIHEFCEARRRFYRGLSQFQRYGRGWLARTNHVERGAKEIAATGDTARMGLDDELRAQATARANVDTPATPPVSPESAGAATGASGIIASVVEQLHKVTDQLAPYQGTIKMIEYALVAIAVVSAGFMIYGMVHNARTEKAIA